MALAETETCLALPRCVPVSGVSRDQLRFTPEAGTLASQGINHKDKSCSQCKLENIIFTNAGWLQRGKNKTGYHMFLELESALQTSFHQHVSPLL